MNQQPPAPEQPQPAPHQPVAPQSPAPGQPVPQPPAYMENPGQTLGIIGLVLNFFGVGIGGIVLGAMSRSKSKQAGMPTVLGTISLVWGIVLTVFAILLFVIIVFVAILSFSDATTVDSNSNSIPYTTGYN